MHDVGKAAEGFQKVLRGEQRNWKKKRHEIISASFASSLKDIPLQDVTLNLTSPLTAK